MPTTRGLGTARSDFPHPGDDCIDDRSGLAVLSSFPLQLSATGTESADLQLGDLVAAASAGRSQYPGYR